MLKDTVWKATAQAFENTGGEPADKLLAALDVNWATMLQRLPQVGPFPKDKKRMKPILAGAPPKKK